jgi:hypothetical protein
MKIELSSRATAQWLPRYNLADRNLWLSLNDLAFSNGNRQSANHFEGNTDWQEEVFKTGWLQDQQIASQVEAKKAVIIFRRVTIRLTQGRRSEHPVNVLRYAPICLLHAILENMSN